MKKIVIYPILFALNPILLIFAANVSDLPLSKLFPGIVVVPLVCVVLFVVLAKLLKNTQRVGFITFLLEIWFFHYGTVHLITLPLLTKLLHFNSHWLLFPTWTLFFLLLGSNLIWNNIRYPEAITRFLNTLALILVIFSSCRIILDILPRYKQRPIANFITNALPMESAAHSKPDIYYIIVDGYARQDVLSTLYQFNNQEFITELENRGLIIPTQSKSNYMQTAISLASSLNMDYLGDISPNMPDRGQLIGMIRHSQIRTVFEQYGYQVIAFASGYQPTEIPDADTYYSLKIAEGNYDFEALVAVNTILKPLFENGLLRLPINRFRTQQERITYTFETLSSLPRITSPKFVFAHLLIPHPPFIYDAHGPITSDEFYILADGERFGGAPASYQLGYIEQLKYTNRMLLETIDLILDNSLTPPVIIIQADHGPGMYLNTISFESSCQYERFSILSAFYLPTMQNQNIPDDITPVNIFRYILNLYFEANFELLPNHQYYSSWSRPYDFLEVTNVTDIPCAIR